MSAQSSSDQGNFFLGLLAKFWLPILLVILAVIFLFQNKQSWQINFLWLHVSGPAWLMSLIIIVIGAVIGSLTVWGIGRHNKKNAE